jgi:hypothetical protein
VQGVAGSESPVLLLGEVGTPRAGGQVHPRAVPASARAVSQTAVFRLDVGKGPWPAVLIYQDGRGVRPALYELGQRIASAGYFAIAVGRRKLPERVIAAASCHDGNLATDDPDSPHLLAGRIKARV